MRDQREKFKAFSRRAFILGGLKVTLLSLLAGRLYQLQILESEQYQTLSKNNSVKLAIVPPFRGNILDHKGNIFVDNEVIYSAIISREYIKNNAHLVHYLNEILGYEVELSKMGIEKMLKKIPRSFPVPIHKNLSWKDIAKISANLQLQEIQIIEEVKRRYIYGSILGHLTGYVAQPTTEEIKNSSIQNCRHFQIGRNGIEKSFNDNLLGKPGIRTIEVNANGRFMRELSSKPPIVGKTLKTSIDLRLQQIVANKFHEMTGSAIVLNPNSGEVMAMYSAPSYDPNQFTQGISIKDWNKIISDSEYPLINKAISASYPPGSIFKIVTALAILSAKISPHADVICTGEMKVGNHTFRCWNKHGHGRVNLKQAIAQSCNIYFYTYGQRAGIDAIASTARKLGLGTHTQIPLPFESAGIVPDKKWKLQMSSQNWTAGDTINTSIGQGYLLATPIQLAMLLAKIVTGKQVIPTLIPNNSTNIPKSLEISEEHLILVREGLSDVFNSPVGTGYRRRIAIPGLEIAGKTSTTQVARLKDKDKKVSKKKLQDHGLFVGYLTDTKQNFLIAIVCEHGGWGSSSALPLAIDVITEYFTQ